MASPFVTFIVKSALALAITTSKLTNDSWAQQRVKDNVINQARLVNTSNAFGLRIYKEYVNSDSNRANVIFSPYSLASALYMLLEGADGDTFEEIKEALGEDARQSLTIFQIERAVQKLSQELPFHAEGYTLNTANSIWTRKGFKVQRDFKDKLTRIFHAEATDVDFGLDGTNLINEWCDRATNHSIPKLFDNPLNPQTVMVLINAIYFKGVWKTQFDPRSTHDRRFFSGPEVQWNNALKVPTMNVVSKFQLARNKELGFQIIALPYEDNEAVMFVILPHEDVNLEDVEANLTYAIIRETMAQAREVKVDVSLPKFKLNSELKLIESLNRVGIRRVFGDLANLSKINKAESLKVDKFVQKAVVEVNERGTEAAASTSVSIMGRSMKSRYAVFDANRPFMFFIKHTRSQLILFAGRVTNPLL